MTEKEIVVTIMLPLAIGVVAFLLKFMFSSIARWAEEKLKSFDEKFKEVNKSFDDKFEKLTGRLDNLAEKVESFSAQFAAAAVKNEHNAEEIKILRLRLHDLAQDVHIVKSVQDRCSKCSKG